jgi:hypothetical protein
MKILFVVYSYNPSYSEGRGRRISVQDCPWQKCETLSEKQKKKKKIGGMA